MQKTGGFVAEGAVNELLRYATRYAEPVSCVQEHFAIGFFIMVVK